MNWNRKLSLLESLEILRLIDEKNSLQDASTVFSVPLPKIAELVQSRALVEGNITPVAQRRNLTNEGKVKLAHLLDSKNSVSFLCRKFDLSERVVRRINKNKEVIRDRLRNGSPTSVKRSLYARFPLVEKEVIKFVDFIREQRIPLSLGIIQTRVKMIVQEFNQTEFKASRG